MSEMITDFHPSFFTNLPGRKKSRWESPSISRCVFSKLGCCRTIHVSLPPADDNNVGLWNNGREGEARRDK
jgi:hypothetical protein